MQLKKKRKTLHGKRKRGAHRRSKKNVKMVWKGAMAPMAGIIRNAFFPLSAVIHDLFQTRSLALFTIPTLKTVHTVSTLVFRDIFTRFCECASDFSIARRKYSRSSD